MDVIKKNNLKKLCGHFIIAFSMVLMGLTPSWAASRFYAATALTGGAAGALDAIDGDDAKGDGSNIPLADNDSAIVMVDSDKFYHYKLDSASGISESSPYIISPDTNPGAKRWVLIRDIDNAIPNVDSYGGIEAAVTAIGATEMTVAVTTAQTIANDFTSPTTLNFWIPHKVDIAAAVAKTWTVKGLILAPRIHFINTTNVTLSLHADSLQRSVYPEWWGIDEVADEVQINLALICAATGYDGYGSAPYASLDAKRYNQAATINMRNNFVGLIGSPANLAWGHGTIIARSSADMWSLDVSPADPTNSLVQHNVVKGITFYHATNAPTAKGHITTHSACSLIIEDCYFINGYHGIYMRGGDSNKISNVVIRGLALNDGKTGTGLTLLRGTSVTNPNVSAFIGENIYVTSETGYVAYSMGIHVASSDGVWFRQCDVFSVEDADVYIAPGDAGAAHLAGLRFSDCYFDTCGDAGHTTGYGISFDITGGGTYGLIKVEDCFFDGNGATTGLNAINFSGTCNARNVQITGCQIFNWGNHGIYQGSTAVNGLSITGNHIFDNDKRGLGTAGITVVTGVSDFQIQNNYVGLTGFGQNNGIVCGSGGSVTHCLISDNICRGNTSDIIQVLGATGVQVKDNIDGSEGSTIASVAAMTLPANGEYFVVSGTAAITSVTASWAGRTVKLMFSGNAAGNGLTDGSNLKLAGNFAYTADDIVVLSCNGTNWYEDSRSVN